MKTYFVVSDVHGFYFELKKAAILSLSKDELNYLLMGMDITQIHLPIDIKYTY